MAFSGAMQFEDVLLDLAPTPKVDAVKEHFSHLIIGVVVSKRTFPKASVLRGLKQYYVCRGK